MTTKRHISTIPQPYRDKIKEASTRSYTPPLDLLLEGFSMGAECISKLEYKDRPRLASDLVKDMEQEILEARDKLSRVEFPDTSGQ